MAFSKLHRHYIDEELSHWKFFCCHSHWLLGFLVFPSHMGVTQFFIFCWQPWHSSCKAWVCSACIFGVCATHTPTTKQVIALVDASLKKLGLWRYQEKQNQNNATKTKCQGRPVAFISKNIKEHLQQLLFTHPVLSKNDIIVDTKITPHETDLGL